MGTAASLSSGRDSNSKLKGKESDKESKNSNTEDKSSNAGEDRSISTVEDGQSTSLDKTSTMVSDQHSPEDNIASTSADNKAKRKDKRGANVKDKGSKAKRNDKPRANVIDKESKAKLENKPSANMKDKESEAKLEDKPRANVMDKESNADGKNLNAESRSLNVEGPPSTPSDRKETAESKKATDKDKKSNVQSSKNVRAETKKTTLKDKMDELCAFRDKPIPSNWNSVKESLEIYFGDKPFNKLLKQEQLEYVCNMLRVDRDFKNDRREMWDHVAEHDLIGIWSTFKTAVSKYKAPAKSDNSSANDKRDNARYPSRLDDYDPYASMDLQNKELPQGYLLELVFLLGCATGSSKHFVQKLMKIRSAAKSLNQIASGKKIVEKCFKYQIGYILMNTNLASRGVHFTDTKTVENIFSEPDIDPVLKNMTAVTAAFKKVKPGFKFTINETIIVVELKKALGIPTDILGDESLQAEEENAEEESTGDENIERINTPGSSVGRRVSMQPSGDRGEKDLLSWELVSALAELSLCETYKLKILNGDTNVLDLIVKILERQQAADRELVRREHEACALYLMNLASHEAGRRLIKQTDKLVQLLKEKCMGQDEYPFTVNNVSSVIELVESVSDEEGTVPKGLNPEGRDQQASQGGRHIFISYCHAQKIIVRRIAEELKKHYTVWIDEEKMEGSTIDSMSKGIDNASVFLLCYSEEYENSGNCRKEAVNADKTMKKIIPLKMTQFDPEGGWLRFVLCDLFYYDFSKGFSAAEMKKLQGALKGFFESIPEVAPKKQKKVDKMAYLSWTHEDVKKELEQRGLGTFDRNKQIQQANRVPETGWEGQVDQGSLQQAGITPRHRGHITGEERTHTTDNQSPRRSTDVNETRSPRQTAASPQQVQRAASAQPTASASPRAPTTGHRGACRTQNVNVNILVDRKENTGQVVRQSSVTQSTTPRVSYEPLHLNGQMLNTLLEMRKSTESKPEYFNQFLRESMGATGMDIVKINTLLNSINK